MKAVSLFSGGGVGCWGWGDLVEWVGAVEMNPKVAAHYRTVYPSCEVVCAAAQDVDYTKWRGIGYLHASPPCTRASVANASDGESDLDMTLARAVVRAVLETKPSFVTVENVQGYLKFVAFRELVGGLKVLGYHVDHHTYNAADYGVPQTRRRLYIRASLMPLPPPPTPTHRDPRKEDDGQGDLFAEPRLPWRGWHEAVADLLPECKPTHLAKWQVERLTAAGRMDAEGNICEPLQVRTAFPTAYGAPGIPAPLPSQTVVASDEIVAVLVRSDNVGPEARAGTLPAQLPSMTLASSSPPKAVLVEGVSAGDRSPTMRASDEPGMALVASNGRGGQGPKAILVGKHGAGGDQSRDGAARFGTVTADGATKVRAVLPTRVVRLSPACLARLMGADGYPVDGVTPTLAGHILGNGDCPPLRRAVWASMIGGKP